MGLTLSLLRQGWNRAYQYNLRLYNARVHSYKAGNLVAKDMDHDEASKYAEEFNIGMADTDSKDAPVESPPNDHDAIAEQLQLQQQQQQADGETKTPKKSGGGRKRKVATPPPEPAVESAKGTPASPDKKRRRTSTKAAEERPEEPKKSGRKKTKSS